MLDLVKLLITFSISMIYIMCVTFVQRFELRSRRFTNFHYYGLFSAPILSRVGDSADRENDSALRHLEVHLTYC